MHAERLYCTLFFDVLTKCSLGMGGGKGGHKFNLSSLQCFVRHVSMVSDTIDRVEQYQSQLRPVHVRIVWTLKLRMKHSFMEKREELYG